MKKIVFLLSFFSSLVFAFNVNSTNMQENNMIHFYLSNGDFGDKISTLTRENLINCEPAIKGTYEYVYNDMITFYPNPELNKGTTYNCSSPGGNTFSFTTEDFRITNAVKISDNKIMVNFNDNVGKDTLKTHLKLYKKEKLAKNDIMFKLETSDEKIYLIEFDGKNTDIVLDIDAGLTSKFGATLGESFVLDAKTFVPFIDSKNASNLDDVLIKAVNFEDGSLGFRIYTKSYISNPSKKYLLIDGITNFSISDIQYSGDMASYFYYLEVKSNDFAPNTSYKVTMLKGFGDYYTLNREEKNFEFTTGDRQPFVAFTDEKNFVPKNSVVSFKSTNLPEVKVIVSRVGEQNFRYFLNYQNEDIINLTKEIISKNFNVSSVKNEITEHKINLDFKDFGDGVYDIGVYYKDEKNEALKSVHKAVYLSDITANVITGDDGIFVLASRLSDTTAIKGAKIEIYSSNNELITSGETDRNGVFSYTEKNFNSKQPKSVYLKKDKEQSFVLLENSVNESTYTQYKDKNETAAALVYFASNIIRPNEDLDGIIVFKNLDLSPIKNLPVKIKIYDPANKEMINKTFTTDEYGTVSLKEKIGGKTGIHRLEAIFGSQILTSKEFSVENFLPNSIKNNIITSKDIFYSGDDMNITFVSTYLFGAPNANTSGYVQASFLDKNLKIEGYDKFSFTNENIYKDTAFSIQYYNFNLNSQGKKQIILPFATNPKSSNAYTALVMFSVMDGSKTVNEYKALTVFPGKTIVGISADKDFIDSDESVNFTTVLLDSKTQKPINGNLDIEIYKNEYNYITSDDGRWHEQNEKILVDSFSATSNNFDYKFNSGGNYVVVVNDYLNSASASANVDVSGYGYYGKQDAKQVNTSIIKLDKQTYKPGDTIKASINSAISKGVLFVSLVDKGVKNYKIIEVKQNETGFEIEIPKDFDGGHINAAIFKDASPSSLPLRTYTNKEIIIDLSEHKPVLSIDMPKLTQNNQDVNIKLTSAPDLKATLFVVDEGALQIINQQELNAFDFFSQASPFGINYYDIFDDLSTYQSKAKALSFGAGSPLIASMKNISPVQAKNIKTFKIMQSKITDANGTAEFSFKTPNNFNSKLRVTALVLGDKDINSQNSYIEVKDDVVIKPAVMLYLIKGDEINFPVTLINTTEFDKNLTMKIAHDDILETNNITTTFNLKPMESINTKFTLKALNLGNSDLNITINDTKATFVNSLNLDVISQYPRSTFAKVGYTAQKIPFNLTDNSYKKMAVGVSNSPSVMNTLLKDNLEKYPYGCTEQITSKLLAYQYNYQNKKDINETTVAIKNYVAELISRLKSDGSFGYWSEFGNTNIFSSIYAADLILSLNENMNLIGNNQKQMILSYLKTGFSDNFLRMYANYILNRHGKLQKSEINYIFDNKIYTTNLVTMYMMAEILKTNSLSGLMSVVLNDIEKAVNNESYKQDNFYGENFNSTIRNVAFALYIHADNFAENDVSKKLTKYLTDSVDITEISSTQQRAFVLRALSALRKGKDSEIDFDLAINQDLINYTKPIDKIFDLNDTKIELSPKQGIFYSLLSFGYEKVPLKHEFYNIKDYIDGKYNNSAMSLKIFREFVNAKGEVVDLNSLKVGDTVYSKLNLVSNKYLQNVLIDEPASSCFEIINERLYPQPRGEAVKNTIDFEHVDYGDERVVSFLNPFNMEVKIFTPYKVVMSGKCALPAVKTEFMQNENIKDYDLEMTHFTVKE